MPSAQLADWLWHLERVHPRTIALGLERVATVYSRLALRFNVPVITVAGTNGKGSTCRMLESCLEAAGYRVGCYFSPHLFEFRERIRVAGKDVDDASICRALASVEAARRDVPLTYFEFATLAALQIFAAADLDALILEVGLGGRLDAVNIVDPDVSILTNVALDHQDYLGDSREEIGHEKAGVFRPGRPAVCADDAPPLSVLAHARALGADLVRIGHDFGYREDSQQWAYWSRRGNRGGLAFPALRGRRQLRNAATVFAALERLEHRLPVSAQALRSGLAEVSLPGRFQVLPGEPMVIVDVAHNPAAAEVLAENLAALPRRARTLAVVGMLRDKDQAGFMQALAPQVQAWFFCSLPGDRGGSAASLAAVLLPDHAPCFDNVSEAIHAAQSELRPGDRLLVTGSFLTVAAALEVLGLAPSNGAENRGT